MNKQIALGVSLVFLALIVFSNLQSLYEGVFFYLRDSITYNADPLHPIQPNGRYHASLSELVRLTNTQRRAYILKQLQLLNLSITEIPIPNSQLTNIFVRFDSSIPLTVFSAHYDKLFDEIEYQGASDNTAAVSVLLASIKEMAPKSGGANRAFLFTGEEERGLRGASAFVEYARDKAHPIPIKEIINFDNAGRGRLAIRPSATVPGFVFTIPFLGDFAYDGRELRSSPFYPPAPARLTQLILRTQPETTVFDRFTARSDSNVYQENAIDTVAISGDNIPYLEKTWHTYADRVELLDEHNLDLMFELILKYRRED